MKIILMLAMLSGVFMDEPEIREDPIAEVFAEDFEQNIVEWFYEQVEIK